MLLRREEGQVRAVTVVRLLAADIGFVMYCSCVAWLLHCPQCTVPNVPIK